MSNNSVPLVINSMFRPFIMELTRRGIDPAPLLASCAIEKENLLEGEHYILVRSWYDFLEASAKTARDPFFGFTVGYDAALPTLPNFELIDLSSRSLGDLLTALLIDSKRLVSAVRYIVANDGEWVTITTKRLFRPGKKPAQIDAFFGAFMANAIKIYSGRRWSPEQLTIWVSDVSTMSKSRLEGVTVLPGNWSGVDFKFPSSWMIQTADEIVDRSKWAREVRNNRFIADFRLMLSGRVHDPALTMESTAQDLSISVATLRRALSRQGTSFSILLTEARFERAKELLHNSDYSIAEIGNQVGFENPSSFARAFRGWSGKTPREFQAMSATDA